ncbi:MAG: type II toxin-antitoxin system RatA family toxin [Endozoicomonadaceae bacterium]|nr:type II toxin-antitoxin system RatA family toxin [Endozoicomonadaceae bacterium]MCY4330388.1 type II toxin-antitoxin system RatA family toxin [Endozoicomonadaceae bacterium]
MKVIKRQALIMHPAQKMYELVNDIESYPKFLPGCSDAAIESRGKSWVNARLELKKAGIKQSFVTHNKLSENRIDMELIEGPFAFLRGHWMFTPLDETGCKINFYMAFSMSNPLLQMTVGSLLEKVASTMVDAFCKRANEVFGQ